MLLNRINSWCFIEERKQNGKDLGCHESIQFASTLIFELVQLSNKTKVVRLHFNGVYRDFCKLKKRGSSGKYDCPYDEFLKRVKKLQLPNW